MAKKHDTIRIDEVIHKELVYRAKKTDRSRSYVVESALRYYFAYTCISDSIIKKIPSDSSDKNMFKQQELDLKQVKNIDYCKDKGTEAPQKRNTTKDSSKRRTSGATID